MKSVFAILASGTAQRPQSTKSLSSLDAMLIHYDPQFSIPFYSMKYKGYGCYCNMMVGDRPLSQPGFGGPALDPIDSACKKYKECLSCVKDMHGEECFPENPLNVISYDLSTNPYSITCTDVAGSCERSICECDAKFAREQTEVAPLHRIEYWYPQNSLLGFDLMDICPDLCGKDLFTLSETANILSNVSSGTKKVDGGYGMHKIVAGRKCYRSGTRLIQWDDVLGRWSIKNGEETIFYSTSNVACPNLAEWRLADGSPVTGIKFNGKTREEVINGRTASDLQCCGGTNSAATLFNAVTHECCGEFARAIGTC